MSHLEKRIEYATRLIGSTVEVVKIGFQPHKDPSVDMYLPCPEYGIGLLVRKAVPLLRCVHGAHPDRCEMCATGMDEGDYDANWNHIE